MMLESLPALQVSVRMQKNKKPVDFKGFDPMSSTGFSIWCERRDSNSHTSRRQNLNLVRLPIPPRSHFSKNRL